MFFFIPSSVSPGPTLPRYLSIVANSPELPGIVTEIRLMSVSEPVPGKIPKIQLCHEQREFGTHAEQGQTECILFTFHQLMATLVTLWLLGKYSTAGSQL